MIKIREDSKLEVWSERYVNYPLAREEGDFDADIIQIEPAHQGGYMVEVVRPDE